MKTLLYICLGMVLATSAAAQSLSPADISRMLDQQAATPNPYAALLNDPDPSRSLGAMKIMMESGDKALIDIALEFGLLSSDPQVQRFAAEQYLGTKPTLSVQMAAADDTEASYFQSLVVSGMDGTVSDAGQGYGRWYLGSYSEAEECYMWADRDTCAFISRTEGFLLSGRLSNISFNGLFSVAADGNLVGTINAGRAGSGVPVLIRLLD